MQDIVMPKKPEKAITVTVRAKSKRKRSTAATGQIPAARVATLKELRKATHHTQDDLAVAMGVGQGTISRIEKRDDMLVSTLQHYVEGVGGTLQILATFPNRPPLVVDCLGKKAASPAKHSLKKSAGPNGQAGP
ncbi:MAG TPA: helix-turn-helix transcriptional regulator [Burkholderiaceae bacterium]|nr:helix-turn-helix transcriptional regulator [Burkholderiaceae bacterium]